MVEADRLTPLQHRAKEVTETFSNYVRADGDRFVPLRIEISKMNFDWTFRLHDGDVWLFDQNTASDDSPEPVARVNNVIIKQNERD